MPNSIIVSFEHPGMFIHGLQHKQTILEISVAVRKGRIENADVLLFT